MAYRTRLAQDDMNRDLRRQAVAEPEEWAEDPEREPAKAEAARVSERESATGARVAREAEPWRCGTGMRPTSQ